MLFACFRAPATRVIISIVVVVSVWIVHRRRNHHRKSGDLSISDKTKKVVHHPSQGLPLPVTITEPAAGWSVGSLVWLPPRFAAVPLSCTADRWADLISDVTLIYDDMRCASKRDMATFAQYIRTCPFLRMSDGTPPRMTVTAVKDIPSLFSARDDVQFTHVAANHDSCALFTVWQTMVVTLVLRRSSRGEATSDVAQRSTLSDLLLGSESTFVPYLLGLLRTVRPCVPTPPPSFGKGFITASSSLLQAELRCTSELYVRSLGPTGVTVCDSFTGAAATISKDDIAAAKADGKRSFSEAECALSALVVQQAATTPSKALSSHFEAVQISLTSFESIDSPSSSSGSLERSVSPLSASGKLSFESITYTNEVMGVRFGMQSGGIVREVLLHEDSLVMYYPPPASALQDASTAIELEVHVTLELIGTLPSTWEQTPPPMLEHAMSALDLLKHNVAFTFSHEHHHQRFMASLQVADLNGWEAIFFQESKDGAECRTYVVPIATHGATHALFVLRWQCPSCTWERNVSALRHFVDNLTLTHPAISRL
jgi:hypothetical protein